MDSINEYKLNFFIGPRLVSHCFKVLHYYHLLLYRSNTAWGMQWRSRKKWNDQEHHVKTSIFHLADKNCLLHFLLLVILIVFKKCILHFLLLVMLFAEVAKRSNKCLQIFFKTGVLKNFKMFTENTCVRATF